METHLRHSLKTEMTETSGQVLLEKNPVPSTGPGIGTVGSRSRVERGDAMKPGGVKGVVSDGDVFTIGLI